MTKSKSLLALILTCSLFIGCEQSEQPLSSRESLLSNGIQILTIDGCQYIKATEGYGHAASVSIIHKANCPNHTTETK